MPCVFTMFSCNVMQWLMYTWVQLIAEGSSKLASVPSGGAAVARGGAGGATAEEEEEEEEEEKDAEEEVSHVFIMTTRLRDVSDFLSYSPRITVRLRRRDGLRSFRLKTTYDACIMLALMKIHYSLSASSCFVILRSS